MLSDRLRDLCDAAVEQARAAARQAVEVIYHLYLGWYERNRFRSTTAREANKQLRVVSALIGVEIHGAERSRT